MKTIKRFIYGIAATLLLSVGLTRAADLLDPITAPRANSPTAHSLADDCVFTCSILEDDSR